MVKMNCILEEIEENFIKYSNIHADINVGYRNANKAAKELIKIYKYLLENTELAKKVIDDIFAIDNINAKIWISDLAIDIDYKKNEAINLLISFGKNKKIGILAMNARLRLADRKIIPIDKWTFED